MSPDEVHPRNDEMKNINQEWLPNILTLSIRDGSWPSFVVGEKMFLVLIDDDEMTFKESLAGENAKIYYTINRCCLPTDKNIRQFTRAPKQAENARILETNAVDSNVQTDGYKVDPISSDFVRWYDGRQKLEWLRLYC